MKRRTSKRERGKLHCLRVSTILSNAGAEYGKLTQKSNGEAEKKGPLNSCNILFWLGLLDPQNHPHPTFWFLSLSYLSSYISLEMSIHSEDFDPSPFQITVLKNVPFTLLASPLINSPKWNLEIIFFFQLLSWHKPSESPLRCEQKQYKHNEARPTEIWEHFCNLAKAVF